MVVEAEDACGKGSACLVLDVVVGSLDDVVHAGVGVSIGLVLGAIVL